MIIKEKDSIDPAITALESLLQRPSLDARACEQIKQEIKTMRSGAKGEEDCAFYLNTYFKPSRNLLLIHDLRFEVDGESVQIDHLLLDRFLTFSVLESKSYRNGLKISDRGEFEYWYDRDKRYCGMASPIEQVKRQAWLLEKWLTQQEIMPRRLGIKFRPWTKTYVLVHPSTSVRRPNNKCFSTDIIVKADAFVTLYNRLIDKMSLWEALHCIPRIVSRMTLHKIAEQMVAWHCPRPIDYAARFGLPPQHPRSAPPAPPACPKCGLPLVLRTAKRGDNAGGKFYGCPKYPQCHGIIQVSATDGTAATSE